MRAKLLATNTDNNMSQPDYICKIALSTTHGVLQPCRIDSVARVEEQLSLYIRSLGYHVKLHRLVNPPT
jgi:hypothetical protein